MTRGQHSRFITIDVNTVFADRHDHVEGLKVMADRRDTVFLRRGECGVDPDPKIGTAALFEKTTFGGRRGGGVLDCWDGQIELFNVVDLLDDVGVLSHVDVDLGLIDGWDVTLCTAEVDREWEGIKGTELSDLVSRFNNHFGLLDEW
jgi:hypothetical protein